MEQTTNIPERVNQHSDRTTISLPEVWTIADIARLYGRSPRWTENLVKSEGFPAPLRGDTKRWWASRVIEFANSETMSISSDAVLTPAPEEKNTVRIKRSAPITRTSTANTLQKTARRGKVGAR
jgi:hypothetical protein